ncbi:PGPGW domain-containing protein [Nocardioides iriomotensis]|nr:PGPGW domain-containing protein [Nocardioides iriomotensis]
MKKVLAALVGGGLVVLGAILMPLPGPGFVIVVAGIAVMATQFDWARSLLHKTRDKAWEAQKAAVETWPRLLTTLASACATIGVGVTIVLVDDVAWPVWDSFFDRFWTNVTGYCVIGTGTIVIVTTVVAIWLHRKEEAGEIVVTEKTAADVG